MEGFVVLGEVRDLSGFRTACWTHSLAAAKRHLSQEDITKNIVHHNGCSPLVMACGHSALNIAQWLLDGGAVFREGQMESVAHDMAREAISGARVISFLLDHGLDINARYCYGTCTLLERALIRNNFNVAWELVERGAKRPNTGSITPPEWYTQLIAGRARCYRAAVVAYAVCRARLGRDLARVLAVRIQETRKYEQWR